MHAEPVERCHRVRLLVTSRAILLRSHRNAEGFQRLAPRLQLEIDGHEIVIGGAAQQNRRPRRDDRRGSRDRAKLADREPIKFWPHRARNQSGKSESPAIGYVGALDLESVLAQMVE